MKEILVLQKISDEPIKVCSECGGELKKVISLGSFKLKGSGWYETDYKKSSSKSSSNESSGSSCETSGSCGCCN